MPLQIKKNSQIGYRPLFFCNDNFLDLIFTTPCTDFSHLLAEKSAVSNLQIASKSFVYRLKISLLFFELLTSFTKIFEKLFVNIQLPKNSATPIQM